MTNNKIADILFDAKEKYTPTDVNPLRDPSLYHKIVGSLVYFTVTHPSSAYVVYIVCQFVGAPTTVHWAAVLQILRYLRAEYRAMAVTTSEIVGLPWPFNIGRDAFKEDESVSSRHLYLLLIFRICSLLRNFGMFVRNMGTLLTHIFQTEDRKQVKDLDSCALLRCLMSKDCNNYVSIWLETYKLYANIASSKIALNKGRQNIKIQYEGEDDQHSLNYKERGSEGLLNLTHTLSPQACKYKEVDNIPALVLDESCLNQQNYSYSLMGKVKEISSLSNLKMVLATEGFDNIELKYMGGYWVMIEFQSEATKTMFETKVGTCTWFSQLQQASNEFTIDGRVTWVEIEGVPLRMWSENTFTRIASKWGVLLHVDDQNERCFHRKRVCIHTNIVSNIFESSKIIYRGKVFWIRSKEVPGWVPELVDDNEEDSDTDDDSKEGNSKEVDVGLKSVSFMGGNSDVEEVSGTKYEEEIQNSKLEEVSVRQKNSHSEDPFNIYELLNKKEGVINKDSCVDYSVKYPPGFSPIGATGEHSNKGGESKKEGGENYEYTHKEEVFGEMKENYSNKSSNEDVAESVCLGHFKKSEVPWYKYQEKDKNKDKTEQNRARDRKEREKTILTVPLDFIGPTCTWQGQLIFISRLRAIDQTGVAAA
ncbi:nucleotide-binding alpha-beta plait domain-containing protein [Tanacetum coccineum]